MNDRNHRLARLITIWFWSIIGGTVFAVMSSPIVGPTLGILGGILMCSLIVLYNLRRDDL